MSGEPSDASEQLTRRLYHAPEGLKHPDHGQGVSHTHRPPGAVPRTRATHRASGITETSEDRLTLHEKQDH